jgi:hypothetical protein
VFSLTHRARGIYADQRMAAKWILAVRNLRMHSAWILDDAVPNWGCKLRHGQTAL